MSQLDVVLAEVDGFHRGSGHYMSPPQKVEYMRAEAEALVDEIRHREQRLQFQGFKTPQWVCPGCEKRG